MDDQLIQSYLSDGQVAELRALLGGDDVAEADTDVAYVAIHRYVATRHFAMPWLQNVLDLQNARILDFGCGTGSTSVALAAASDRVHGIDVDASAVEIANGRAAVMGVADRVNHHAIEVAEDLPLAVASSEYDLILLSAVLPYMTFEARIKTLRMAWEMLPDGGHLAILESPNRFCLWDYHASLLPQFHLEPLPLQRYLVPQSPRPGFNTLDPVSDAELSLSLQRWGTGLSHNDLQFALGDDIFDACELDGLEQETTDWYPAVYEDVLLYNFYRHRQPHLPAALSRHTLNVVFKKGHSGGRDYCSEAARLAAYEQRLTFCSQQFDYEYFLPQMGDASGGPESGVTG